LVEEEICKQRSVLVVTCPKTSVTRTVNDAEAFWVGVPVMVPSLASVKPAGTTTPARASR